MGHGGEEGEGGKGTLDRGTVCVIEMIDIFILSCSPLDDSKFNVSPATTSILHKLTKILVATDAEPYAAWTVASIIYTTQSFHVMYR